MTESESGLKDDGDKAKDITEEGLPTTKLRFKSLASTAKASTPESTFNESGDKGLKK
jgi:hypothetical protein